MMTDIRSKLSLSLIPKELIEFDSTNFIFEKEYLERQQNQEKLQKELIRKASQLDASLQAERRQREVRVVQLNSQIKDTEKALQESKEKEDCLNLQVDEKNKRLSELKILNINDDDLISYKMKLNNLFNAIELKKSQLKQDFKKLSFAVLLYKRELGCNVTCVAKDTVIFTPNIYGMNKSKEYIKLRIKDDTLYFECVDVSSQILDPNLVDEYKKRKDVQGLVLLFMKTFNDKKKLGLLREKNN